MGSWPMRTEHSIPKTSYTLFRVGSGGGERALRSSYIDCDVVGVVSERM